MDIPETRYARSGDVSIAYHEWIDDDDLVPGSGISFLDRGSAALKGVPGEWRLFVVEAQPA